MKWLQCRAAMLVTLLGASLGLNAEDRFYIPDFDIAAGESKQIAIHYESSEIDKRCGFQFDLYLPEGLTVEKKKNKYNFTFNTDRNDDHTMSSSDQPDGAIRVVGISMSSAQFWEAAGEFIYFTVTAASDFTGSHEVTISEIQFSDLKGTLIPVADSKTVINPGGGEILATGITLDKITAELTEGETLKLTATVTPENATDKTVTWTSSDETVATVVDGVVTALKAGKATITAKAGDVSATCELTVNAKVIPATGITIDKTTAELTEGETLTLTATVSPEDATDKTVTWTSSDETVATVANGVVTALKAGKATITAANGGNTATCELTVNAKTSDDRFYIPDFEIAAGESKQIAIHYESSEIDKRCGFQFDLYLPEGLTVEKKKNKYNFTFNTDRNDDHTMSSSDQPDGAIRVVGISMSSAQFWEAAGEFIYFTVTAASDFTGSHEVRLSGVQFSTLTGTLIPIADSKATITGKTNVIPATGITLDKTTAELTEGETLTLTATVTPENATDKTVAWTSSDETVATVKDGVVTALKAGKATITAKSGEVSATCEITVNAKVIPATGITLDKTTAELTEGETLTLTATVSPEDATDKTVVWTSSDETVATVANGVVTALKAGKVTITAKSGEVSATCEITVNAKVIPATGITLDKTTAEMIEGETLTLTATVTPEDATDKTVTWTSSDEAVVKVVNGVVSALKTGKATITATSGDVSATCEITVIPVTGINGVICSDGYAAGNVYTVAGNLVCRKGEKLSNLPKGLYIVDGKKIVVK